MQKKVDNMISWKEEQLSYFKEYINQFQSGTREHSLINQGIELLEKNK
jgi:hypothetical protein